MRKRISAVCGTAILAAGVLTLTMTAAATPAQAAWQSRMCTVDEVAVIGQRMHIKCEPEAAKPWTREIPYYAAALADGEAKIGGYIAVALEAQRRKVPLRVWLDMEDYKSVPGCAGNDCRKLQGAAID